MITKNYLPNKFFLTFIVVFLFFISKNISSEILPDYNREQNISSQFLHDIFDGELISLSTTLNESFKIVEYKSNNNKQAVLLFHGRGLHPNEHRIMQPLRIALYNEGYNTYSIQLPVLPKGKTYYDYFEIFKYSDERINSSLEYIASSNKSVFIIAHSCGVHMLMSWLESNNFDNIAGLILIGSEPLDLGQKLLRKYPYNKIKVPILDIYGENDYPSITKNATARFKMIKQQQNNKSNQVSVPNSDHYHTDNANELLKVVKTWLKTI
tara:strand:- start:81 stop:881 length:801 start_codon:yes stop_codon:yes gene_type:complete